MKPIRPFVFAALVALMALASVDAGSAVAEETALCSADENPCSEAIEHIHETGKALFLNSVLHLTCDQLFLGDSLPFPSTTAHGSTTYSNCTSGCTVTEENGPAEVKILREGSELAKVTGEFLFHVVCSGFLNCRYNGVGLVGHALGPLSSSEENGSIVLSEQTLNKESGTFCPSTAKLDITTTPLEPVYISS